MSFFAGLDVHKEFVQACVVDGTGQIVKEGRFSTNNVGLNNLVEIVKQASCVIESSTACFPVYDFLQENKVKVRVAHPKRVKAICSAKNKTDKIDSRMLAQLERSDLIPEAHIPSRQVRDYRDLVRHHVDLVQQRTRIINQTKAGLLKNRVVLPKNLCSKKAKRLAELTEMPESLRLKINHFWSEMELLSGELKIVDQRIQLIAEQNSDCVLLRSIKGLGWFSAFTVVHQVDDVARFPSVDQLVSYAGLCPRIKQSGNTQYMKGIGNDCSKLLRWILIQDAWSVVKFNPYFKKIYKKLLKKKKKQKAIVGVAKKLLRTIYFMLRDKTTFQPKKKVVL